MRWRAVVIWWLEVVGHGGGVMMLVVMILFHPQLGHPYSSSSVYFDFWIRFFNILSYIRL